MYSVKLESYHPHTLYRFCTYKAKSAVFILCLLPLRRTERAIRYRPSTGIHVEAVPNVKRARYRTVQVKVPVGKYSVYRKDD